MGEITRRTTLAGVSATALTVMLGLGGTTRDLNLQIAQSAAFDPVPQAPFTINDRVQRYVKDGWLFIEAIDLSLKSDFIPKTLNLIVLADRLRVDGPIILPGKSVILAAREIAFAPNSVIDTSGANGASFKAGERAAAGAKGRQGENGDNGDSGKPAGDIWIIGDSIANPVARANGGNGGYGESGGHGYTGAKGTPSRADGDRADTPSHYGNCTRGLAGGDGEDGTMPGSPGKGGDAGNSGRIVIRSAGPITGAALTARAGEPGPAGMRSGGGEGGFGGFGGASWKYEDYSRAACREGSGDCHGSCSSLDDEPDGKDGRTYVNRTMPVAGSAGKTITPTSSTAPTAAEVAKVTTLSFADLIIARAELDYIGGDIPAAARRLAWINEICRAAAVAQAAHAPSWTAKDHHTSVLITQIRQHLNFFGADLNWIPAIKPDVFDQTLDHYFAAITALERDGDKLDQYEGKLQAFQERIREAEAVAQSQIADLDGRITSSITDQNETWAEIERLNGLAELLGTQIQQADAAFKSAVARQSRDSGGCDMFDQIQKAGALLTAIKTASVVAGGGLPAFVLAAKTLGSFKPPKDASVLDQMIGLTGAVTAAADSTKQRITQIQDAWTKVKDAAGALQPRQAPPLIKLDRESYRATLREFQSLPEARALGGLLDRYFDALDARNQGYANIESLVAQRSQMRVTIESIKAEAKRLDSIRANANQPGLTEFAAILRRRLTGTKRIVSTIFAQQARAISYYKAEDVALPALEETRVALMMATRGDLKRALLEAKGDRGQRKDTEIISLSFDRDSTPEAFAAFVANNYLPFIVAEKNKADGDEFDRWWGLEIKKVDITLQTEDRSNVARQVRAALVHMGNTSVRGRDGKFRQFTHKPRAMNVVLAQAPDQANYITPKSEPLLGDREFIYPSPYGAWRLSIFDPDLTKIDRSKITGITLRFAGAGMPYVALQTG